MADFPNPGVTPLFISSPSPWAAGLDYRNTSSAGNGPAATNWPSANLAIFIPFFVPWQYPVNRVFWANGTSAAANKAFGIYTIGGSLVYTTGSTVESGSSAIQYVTPSPTFTLYPGRYYMALNCSGTTSHGFGMTTTAIDGRIVGLLQQAVGSMTFPATMTGAQFAQTFWPLCGITKTTSGF